MEMADGAQQSSPAQRVRQRARAVTSAAAKDHSSRCPWAPEPDCGISHPRPRPRPRPRQALDRPVSAARPGQTSLHAISMGRHRSNGRAPPPPSQHFAALRSSCQQSVPSTAGGVTCSPGAAAIGGSTTAQGRALLHWPQRGFGTKDLAPGQRSTDGPVPRSAPRAGSGGAACASAYVLR